MVIRESKNTDKSDLQNLYLLVSENQKGIAMSRNEISELYISNILKHQQQGGLNLLGYENNILVAEIHASKYDIEIFNHILTNLTIVVHPEYQGKGYGKRIFKEFLTILENKKTDIYRVELESRSSNKNSIQLYELLGFEKEGVLKNKTRNLDGTFEDSIQYAWFNKNFNKI